MKKTLLSDHITEVETPLVEEDSLLVDKTEHSGIVGDVLRVELRRTRDPTTGTTAHTQRIVDRNYIIGLIGPDDLPEEGRAFKMAYHLFNNQADFGNVDSSELITDVLYEEGCYYFTTSEGDWRLKVLDVGN